MRRLALLIAANALFPAFSRGAPVCASCHPGETRRFLSSPMGTSLGPPSAVEGGQVAHQRSGSTITIVTAPGDRMLHKLSAQGLTAAYEIAYQIGAGKLAHTYLVEVKGYLFESPATWFRSYGWDLSPGYAQAQAIDFDRPITETCLFCHAGGATFSGTDGRKVSNTHLTAITCERCHGDSAEHLRRPSAGNIINPAKLPKRARDSVCEQCHLEGEARILNPGKSWRNYRPGDNFEQIAATYVFQHTNRGFGAVNQVEQLAESRCAIASGGALWCGTCHSVHGESSASEREVSEVCLSCHTTLSKAAHPEPRSGCTRCHMPQVPTRSTHVAVTDHRILRRPGISPARALTAGAAPAGDAAGGTLVAWVEPPIATRQRDLTLANLTAGLRLGIPAFTRTGMDLLATLPASQRREDAGVLVAACEALLDHGAARDAVQLCGAAAVKVPESADRAMNLGTALARAGNFAAAERELNRAITLDPSLKHAYVELWSLYDRQQKLRQLIDTSDRFLAWNPQNIMFRVLKAAIQSELEPPLGH